MTDCTDGKVLARYCKYSICKCGFPILSESVPLGKVYSIYPARIEPMFFACGGCGKQQENVMCVYVDDAVSPGYLPLEIFTVGDLT